MRVIQEDSENLKARENRTSYFLVEGMTCYGCARSISDAIKRIPGVNHVSVDFNSGTAVVVWKDVKSKNPQKVADAIQALGYKVKIATKSDLTREADVVSWKIRLLIGIVCTSIVAVGEWVANLGDTTWFRWVEFFLATLVMWLVGSRFFLGAARQLKVKKANMDTLVSIGASAAYLYSVWLCVFSGEGGHVFFLESMAILTFISAGHWIEARLGARASATLEKLLSLAPETALRVKPEDVENLGVQQASVNGTIEDGSELRKFLRFAESVNINELKPGDIIVLRAGENIPTDGVVISGYGQVDESMLTGEPMPREKRPGSVVYAGTLNQDGILLVKVTAVGEETALARIVEAIRRAQASRAEIQRIADKISAIFVPVIVVIALGVGLWWVLAYEQARAVHALLSAFLWHMHLPDNPIGAGLVCSVAVLIVACPCAMGLATPAAIMAASNTAARIGVLIRDATAIEKSGRIDVILLDKTGTLTKGEPVVTHYFEVGRPVNMAGQIVDLKTLAASLAWHSRHPVSRAIAGLMEGVIPVREVREVRGRGIQGRLDLQHGSDRFPTGREAIVRLGSLDWLDQQGVKVEWGSEAVEDLRSKGATVVGLAVDENLAAIIGVADKIRPEAPKIIQALGRMGYAVGVVSGDSLEATKKVAEDLGLSTELVFGGMSPTDKADLIQTLQQKGHRVAFVGDGINDAPALEQADLGVAVSSASDIARQAADIILIESRLDTLPKAIKLSQRTIRIIKQNLFWAFFYNTLSVPLAGLGFLSPMICALAMGLSDIFVIANALRLLKVKALDSVEA